MWALLALYSKPRAKNALSFFRDLKHKHFKQIRNIIFSGNNITGWLEIFDARNIRL